MAEERPVAPGPGRGGYGGAKDAVAVAMECLPVHQHLGLQFLQVRADIAVCQFRVSEASMQPFRSLHGGVSALVAEGVASAAGAVAAKGRPALGLDVSCSHLRGAPIGTNVLVVATPLRVGRTIQVWEVKLFRAAGPVDAVTGSYTWAPSGSNEAEVKESSREQRPMAHEWVGASLAHWPVLCDLTGDKLLALSRVTLFVAPDMPQTGTQTDESRILQSQL